MKGVDGLVGNCYFVMEVFTHVQMFFFFLDKNMEST